MQSIRLAAVAALAVACAMPAAAQTIAVQPVTAQPAPPPIAQAPTANAVLRAGTPVQLRFMETITTKKKAARVGQRVQLEVAAPVEVNGVVVIPAGTPAWGEITSVRNKGMWGKSGKLEGRALFARVNGRQIRLSGTFDDKGVTGTAAVVGALAIVPVAGFFMTGTSAELPQGAQVGAFIDEDVELAIANAAPAPMVVGAPAAAMAVEAAPAPAATMQTASSVSVQARPVNAAVSVED